MKRSCIAFLLILVLAAPVLATEHATEDAAPGKRSLMLKSLLWPGLGQIEQGRIGRGSVWAGGAALLAAGTFLSHTQYHDAATDFEFARESYELALDNWDLESAQAYLADMERLHPIAEDRQSYRTAMEIALILWWGGNLVDVWLFDEGGEGSDAMKTSALPGRIDPVLRRGAAGLVWNLDF